MMRSQNHQSLLIFSWGKALTGILGIIGVILSALFWLPTSVCFAQELSPINNQSQPVVTESEVGDTIFDANSIPSEKVSQFIQAYLQVLELIDRRQGELLSAETKIASQRLEKEIESQAQEIIQQSGLSRQEYLQLLSLANLDPEFGERIAVGLQEAK
jgi:hypothetical protein